MGGTLAEVAPSEQVTVEPVTANWSDLLQLQRSQPRVRPADVQRHEPVLTLEPPILEIDPSGRVLPSDDMPGVEKLGPCTGFGSVPSVSLAFDSQLDVPDGAGFSFIPPDVAGAVGPAHLMTMLENQVRITSRLDGSPLVVDTSTFWSPLGSTPLSPTHVYPRVVYDDLHGRWLASIRNGVGSLGTTTIFFAISATDDPTGTWTYYAIPADPLAASQADWLQLGYNATWIVFTANMFNLAGTTSLGAKMWALDKASVLAGGPVTLSIFPAGFMSAVHPGAAGSSVMPARTLDGTTTLYLINNSFTSGGVWLLQITQITGTGGAPVASGLPGSPFGGTTSFCFVTTNFSATQRAMAQVGDARFISPFSVRTASVAVRNGKIWVAMSGGLPGPATNAAPTSNGVIWHEIDPALPFPASSGAPGSMLVQSSAISNGVNTMSMYPSLAVNCAEDLLVGFANGDATINPQAAYAMRLGTDPLNSMGPVTVLKAGESSYWKNFGVGTTAQYGRYSATCVDPNDDTTLWTLQQYADTRVGLADNDSRWGTWWGRLGDCEELPEITDQPDSYSGCVGDPVTFTVMVTSGNPVTYQWRKDGVDILGANSDSYSIPVTVSGDAGVYDCVVCGCGQVISDPAVLTFNAPVITLQPVNQLVAIGGTASFMVAASGTGTLSYQWTRDNVPVGPDSDTLVISPVTAVDYGDYVCTVTDDCGPVSSIAAKLGPPLGGKFLPGELSLHILNHPVSTTACVGSSAVFSVTAYPDDATYVWRFNGSPIVPPETNPTLVISSVTPGDAGAYDVIVTKGPKSKTSVPAGLTVIDVAVITQQPGPVNQTVGPGTVVTYSTLATGDGPITYQWQKRPQSGGGSVQFSDMPGETGTSLSLGAVNSGDNGTYRCRITNPCGTVNTVNCRLTVL
ncbi:MAG TPA: immunoglobulin domain-containing protein [Planctomycetota bacterium]